MKALSSALLIQYMAKLKNNFPIDTGNKFYYNHVYASSWHISASRFISLLNGAHRFSNGFLLSLNPNPEIL